jgi:hypothetical protein
MGRREAVLAKLREVADELEATDPARLEELVVRLRELVRFENRNNKLDKNRLT